MADTHLRAIITAVDKLSPVLAVQARNIRAWSTAFKRVGRGAIPMAAGLGVALGVPTRAFMEAEDAATQLKNTLMTSDGATAGFEQLSKIATDLGNKLPGTTADFYQMASTMKALGVSTESLIGGSLAAAANLAVVAKPLGVTYDQAAESIGKLGRAFGISGQEMVPFADTLQRALHMGGDLEQMQYAMSRIAGPLKMLGKQGLTAANEMVPLVSLLSQAGLQGEAIGTGIQNMIEALTAKGQYKGVQSLVDYLEQIHKLAPAKQLETLNELFGQHATKASIIGAGGYNEVVKGMAQQASLNQRVANSLGTLTNAWEALSGTVVNVMAAFAESYAPELKDLATYLNDLSAKAMDWVKNNKPMINTIVKLATAFAGMKLAIYGIGIALAFVARLIASLTPIGALLQLIALAAPLIWQNWDAMVAGFNLLIEDLKNWLTGLYDKITGGFSLAFEAAKTAANSAAEGIKGALAPAIDSVAQGWASFADRFPAASIVISDVVGTIADSIMNLIGGAISAVAGLWDGLIAKVSAGIEAVAGFVSSLGGANMGSMTLPGQSLASKPLNTGGGSRHSLDINHVNAPAGFRAAPVKSRGAPFKVQQNVGYNYSVTGAW